MTTGLRLHPSLNAMHVTFADRMAPGDLVLGLGNLGLERSRRYELGRPDATVLCAERDLAPGVPGQFPLARCERCGPLDSRLGRGLVKLVLEIALEAAGPARRGDLVRSFIHQRGPG